MNTIFKRKKTPEALVRLLNEAFESSRRKSISSMKAGGINVDKTTGLPIESIQRKSSGNDNIVEQDTTATDLVTKRLNQIKIMLYGEGDQVTNLSKCALLSVLLINENLPLKLIQELPSLSFEARKQLAQIYNNLIRRDLGNFVIYVERNPIILSLLINGYGISDIALSSGTMLRESIRHERLAKVALYSEDLWKLFDHYVHLPNFDVASDAFASFKDILTRHKNLSSQFFEENFDKVFEKYNQLLCSENYVTRRQSLRLLGEILLDRANFNIMMKYIGKKENLKMMMNLLRDKSANIQFEAFHVFKVFVANPQKPDDVIRILLNNKEKLVAYLRNFQNEKEDEQFSEEKALLIKTLENLQNKQTDTSTEELTKDTSQQN